MTVREFLLTLFAGSTGFLELRHLPKDGASSQQFRPKAWSSWHQVATQETCGHSTSVSVVGAIRRLTAEVQAPRTQARIHASLVSYSAATFLIIHQIIPE